MLHGSRCVVAVLVLIACLGQLTPVAAEALNFTICSDAFNSTVTDTPADSSLRCQALQVFSNCVVGMIKDANISSFTDPSFIEATQIVGAARDSTDFNCNAFTLIDMTNLAEVEGNTVIVHVYDSVETDFRFYRYSRDSFRFQDLYAALNSVSGTIASFQIVVNDPILTAKAAVQSASSSLAQQLTDNVMTSSEATTASISTAASEANRLLNQASYGLPGSVTNMYNMLVSQIDAEANNLEKLRATFADQINYKLQGLMNAQVDDAVDRNRIVNEDNIYLGSITGQINNAISTFVATEDSRAAVSAQAFADLTADAQNYASQSMAVAIAGEAARAASKRSTLVGSIGFSLPQRTGSTDFAACLSTEEGTIYVSTSSYTMFFCDGLYWNQIFTYVQSFSGSRIVDYKLAVALEGPTASLNYHRWILCYSGSQQGWSANTFHNNCNYKGKTLTIAKVGTKIFGAFQDDYWYNRQNYGNGYFNTFLWRYNNNLIDTARPTNYGGSYAFYDYSPYCPTFGGGHDWYNDGSCRSGYTSQHTYIAPGYNSNWLLGSSSWTADEFEVWYRGG